MNKQEMTEGILYAGFRLVAVIMILAGSLALLFQLVDSWYRFDPNYLGTFLWSTVLRPFCLLVVGTGLYLLSARLARRMAARLES